MRKSLQKMTSDWIDTLSRPNMVDISQSKPGTSEWKPNSTNPCFQIISSKKEIDMLVKKTEELFIDLDVNRDLNFNKSKESLFSLGYVSLSSKSACMDRVVNLHDKLEIQQIHQLMSF